MNTHIYLVLNKRGLARTTKERAPSLQSGEIAFGLTINVDDGYFDHSMPEVTVNIRKQHVIRPQITVEPDLAPTEPVPTEPSSQETSQELAETDQSPQTPAEHPMEEEPQC